MKPEKDFELIYSINRLFRWTEVYYSARRGWCISQRGQLRYFQELGDLMSHLARHQLIEDEGQTWELLRRRSDEIDDKAWSKLRDTMPHRPHFETRTQWYSVYNKGRN